jgi:pimeloyl-ACP methyl ester carboxylesterase
MHRLGYTRYVAQGGDWGAIVTTKLAQQQPAGLAGIHLNFPQVFPDPLPTTLSPAEQRAVDGFKRFQVEDFGYFQLQMTRPQTMRSRIRRWARPPGSTRNSTTGPTMTPTQTRR